MKIKFRSSNHYLQSLLRDGECPAATLDVLGRPLITFNVASIMNCFSLESVLIPNEFPEAADIIQDSFPELNVQQFADDSLDSIPIENHVELPGNMINFEMPINSLILTAQSGLIAQSLVYPWDFLKAVQKALGAITRSIISTDAYVAKTSVLDGPCIIEDGVNVDDFCKIKGPVYIGKNSFIGMSSLVRSCMLGSSTKVGFNCEIAKSYFAGDDKVAHQNVILDSIIGRNVWFGGYSGTANVLLNRKNIRFNINGGLVDTGTDHFGAVVGCNCAIGASVIILPGRQIPPNTLIQAGTIVGKNSSLG